jgi:hypothetical protein
LQVAVAADDGEARAEGSVEAGGADDGVNFEDLAGVELDAFADEAFDARFSDIDVGFSEGVEVPLAWGHSPATQGEVGD